MVERKYGWRPDKPDFRDHRFKVAKPIGVLPPKIDLREWMPSVYDQGSLGSCTGNAIAGSIQYNRRRSKQTDFVPSRLFIYYNERVMEGTVPVDAGAEIRDGIKSVATDGACTEITWPYDVRKFTHRPSQEAYDEAKTDVVTAYMRVEQSAQDIRSALAEGHPVVFGMMIYTNFESDSVAKTGRVEMPNSTEKALGGHAILIVGYDDAEQRFTIRNSWGEGWGLKGYFTLPYQYVLSTDLCSDFWVIQSVNGWIFSE